MSFFRNSRLGFYLIFISTFLFFSSNTAFAVVSTQITNYPTTAYDGQGEMYAGVLWYKSGSKIYKYTGSGSITLEYTIANSVNGVSVGFHWPESRVDIDANGIMYFATGYSPNQIWSIDVNALSNGPTLLFSGLTSSTCNAYVGGLIRVNNDIYFSCPDAYTDSNDKIYKFAVPSVGAPAKGTSDLTTVLNATTTTRVTDLDYRSQDGMIFAVQGNAGSGQAAYISKFNPSASLPVTPTTVKTSSVSSGLGGIWGMSIDSVGNIFYTTYQNGSFTPSGFQITSESPTVTVATVFSISNSGYTWEVYLRGWILDQGSQSTSSSVIGYLHGSYGGIIKVSGTAPSSSATVIPNAPTNSVVPAISGVATFNQTVSASNGTWTNSPTSYTYQWSRSATSGGTYTNISGATSSSYLLGSADVGKYLKVSVTATNAGGSSSAFASAFGPVGSVNSTTDVSLVVGTLTYRLSKSLSATASAAGKVTFRANNQVIPGCKGLSVSAGNSYTRTCLYRPSNRGYVTIRVNFVPTDSSYSSSSASTGPYFVSNRTGNR